MKIILAGSSGLIGKALTQQLAKSGHSILKLVRKRPLAADERFWDPALRQLDPQDLEGVDAVINLAGENIAGRWTAARKRAILESRTSSTQLLAKTLAGMSHPPKLLINASAIGYYGDRGDELLTEAASSGTGFLADVCRAWETATEPAERAGLRVIHLRLGIVLSREGGALMKMLMPFKFGLGGVVGSGNQYMSWIALDDLVRLVEFSLQNSIQGAVNAVSPAPVTNRAFTKALGSALHRPTLMPLPAFAVNLLLGEMGQEMLLNSVRVVPEKLTQAGFKFQYPELLPALEHLVN